MIPKIKVLYIFLDNTKSSGVIKKVKSKIKLLNENGVSTLGIFINKNINEYYLNTSENVVYVPFKVSPLSVIYNRRYIRNFKKIFEYNNNYKQLYLLLTQEILKREYDLILFRYPLANKYLYKFVNNHRDKIVFEHNSKELIELCLKPDGNFSKEYKQELKYGSKVLKLAKGITGVGKEVTAYEIERSKRSHFPNRVISNSFEVASVKKRTTPHLDNKNYNILFVTGSPSPWVGIDIVLKSLKQFKSNAVNVKLFIVGPKAQYLVDIVNELQLQAQVHLEGEKLSSELDYYFDFCHVAFGTMAMYRVGLSEHSSLKVLEYSSRGIPFVLGYDDTNFVENEEYKEFYLKIDCNEKCFDFEEVIKFTNRVFEIENHSDVMRNLSMKYIDTSIKMKELSDFLISFYK